jgi:hypothetical protein
LRLVDDRRRWLALAVLAATSAVAAPLHAQAGEDVTNVLDQAIREAGAPALEALVVHSRDEALASGVEPVPDEVRRQLAGFVTEDILNAARFRVAGGDEVSLQFNAMQYGDALAITLDYVIVFKNEEARHDIGNWVHELTHVAQYRRWGIRDFAARYLEDADAVEDEAYDAEKSYAAWAEKGAPLSPGAD